MDAFAEMIGGLLATMPGAAAPNRSAPMSIQQAVASAMTPVPSYPAAAGPAFTPAPPSAFTPPPPSAFTPPVHGGYVPPPIPPTLPVGGPQRMVPTAHVAKPKSNALLFVIVGIIAFGGAGVGVWVATKDKKHTATPTDPVKGSDQPEDPEHKPDPDDPDEPDKPDPWSKDTPDPWGDKTHESDPGASLGHGKAKQLAPPDKIPEVTTKKTVGTAKTPLPSGAYISPPDGFVETKLDPDSKSYINYDRGLLLVMGPLEAGTNDPKKLAAGWVKATGSKLVKSQKVPSHGASRDALIFSATYNGVPVLQIAVLYITDNYRIGVLLQTPVALFSDNDFQNEVDEIFEDNVHLP
jgi:hypothetical protein